MGNGCGNKIVYIKGDRGPEGKRGPQGEAGTSGAASLIRGVNNVVRSSSANTSENSLLTFSLNANELTKYSEFVKWTTQGETAANSRSKTIRFKIDGVELFVNTATAAANNLAWKLEVNVFKDGDSPGNVTLSYVECTLTFNGIANEIKVVSNASLNWDQAQIFEITTQVGVGAVAGDITLTGDSGLIYKK